MNSNFLKLTDKISDIGLEWHKNVLIENTKNNLDKIEKGISAITIEDDAKKKSAIVVSAGPSLHYKDSLRVLSESNYEGSVIAIDGSLVKCLKAGIVPDYVLTLDPHPTRLVRWFGDPDILSNLEGDDYFSRQDLDIDFRNDTVEKNSENIDLVNKYANKIKLIISTTAPNNVVRRVSDAGFDCFWWVPLVDNPSSCNSLTRKMYDICKLPAMNTGGNVGTAAWIFAKIFLKIKNVCVVGMDLGYQKSLPYKMTQTFYELRDILSVDEINSDYFPEYEYPNTGEKYYIDPTYYWYRCNLMSLIKNSGVEFYNCTEGGTLFGDGIKCLSLEKFINEELA